MAAAIPVRHASLFGHQHHCWACGAHYLDFDRPTARCPDCGQLAGLDSWLHKPPPRRSWRAADRAASGADPVLLSELLDGPGWHIET